LQLSHENIPSALHGSPTDAVSIHLDVKSRNTVGMSLPPSLPFSYFGYSRPSHAGIHFGTFIGAEAESLEAVIELQEACEAAGVGSLDDAGVEREKGRMGVIDIGETIVVEIADLVIV
jgi:N-acyl-phosphatidylethanolamine-hydrolysing phospholipase D